MMKRLKLLNKMMRRLKLLNIMMKHFKLLNKMMKRFKLLNKITFCSLIYKIMSCVFTLYTVLPVH